MKHTIQTGFKPYRPAPAPVVVKGTGDTARLFQSLKDNVEEFVQMAIQEFLTNKGFKRTLVAFQNEQQTISNVRPSDESWYKVSDYIDLVGIREATRKRGEATYSTVLESMVLFLKSQRESKLSSAKSAPVLAAVPRDDEAQDPRISTNPLKDCDPVFLYAEQQRAKAEMEAAEADRRARRQQEAESESQQGSSVREMLSSSGTHKAASNSGRRRPRKVKTRRNESNSVHDLQRRLASSRSPSAKPRTAKVKSRTTASFPMLGKPRQSRTATLGGRKRHLMSTDMMDEMSMLHSGSVGPSEEKWIPLENRLRMLKREMEAFKYNNDRHTKHLEDLHKSQPRGAELERAKKREHYSGKKKKRCSLCEQQFALVNLPLAISYKAILDLRTSWGVDVEAMEPNPNMARFPHYYNEVRVCTFCAQFFDEKSSYRAIAAPKSANGSSPSPSS